MAARCYGRRSSGAALGLAVLLMLILSITGFSAIQMAYASRTRSIQTTHYAAARYAADAGIERAIYQMNQALAMGSWPMIPLPSFVDQPLTASSASYSVSVLSIDTDTFQITSTGKSGNATRTVQAIAKLTSPIGLGMAALARSGIELKTKALVKGYHSGDPNQKNLRADIGTLSSAPGAINIKNKAEVFGDVYIGLNGDPNRTVLKDQDSIKGEILKNPYLPTLTLPGHPTLPSKGKLTASNITLSASDSGTYSTIEIAPNGQMTIDGHCVLSVIGDLILKNNAQIKIKQNGSLILYLGGDLESKYSAGFVNESKIPAKLKLYGTAPAQRFSLKNDTDFYGVVYAPHAVVELYNGGSIYGAVVADHLEMKNSGNLWYDHALRTVSINEPAVCFVITKWKEL